MTGAATDAAAAEATATAVEFPEERLAGVAGVAHRISSATSVSEVQSLTCENVRRPVGRAIPTGCAPLTLRSCVWCRARAGVFNLWAALVIYHSSTAGAPPARCCSWPGRIFVHGVVGRRSAYRLEALSGARVMDGTLRACAATLLAWIARRDFTAVEPEACTGLWRVHHGVWMCEHFD